MSVPPRWLNCPRKGKVIGGKFLPFKTPLSSRYEDVPESHRFDVAMLVSYVEALQLKLGLVVDLTKTDRFYDKRELYNMNIGYYKLMCEGFAEAPTQEQVHSFNQFSKRYFEQHRGEIIGVHCTHGYNRTGFLIIAYLVEMEDWSLEAAVATFADARPPGIYKAHYLKELADRYNAGNMVDFVVPERPSWCDEDDKEDDYEVTTCGTNPVRKGGTKRGGEFQNELAKFMDGVSGVDVVRSPKREEIQQQCRAILRWDGVGFGGSQPVSMDVQNIGLLNKFPYRVSWKADGTRYIMYIRGRGETYMLDRDNSVFIVAQLSFPSRKREGEHVIETLVDGEMVLDKTPEGGLRPRYLMYDIVQFERSTYICQCDHMTRLQCIERELIAPREEGAKKGTLDKQVEPFGVRAKLFWDVSETKMVLNQFVKKITHETDGLIFSPALEPYTPGRTNSVLKWKPADMNTVDFKLLIVEKQQAGTLPEKIGQLYVNGYKEPFATINLKRNRDAKLYHGRIIECYWDKNSGWNFLRVREDKSHPNGFITAKSVCQSINQPVTKEWLFEVVERHRWKPPSSLAGQRRPHSGGDEHLMPPPKLPPRASPHNTN